MTRFIVTKSNHGEPVIVDQIDNKQYGITLSAAEATRLVEELNTLVETHVAPDMGYTDDEITQVLGDTYNFRNSMYGLMGCHSYHVTSQWFGAWHNGAFSYGVGTVSDRDPVVSTVAMARPGQFSPHFDSLRHAAIATAQLNGLIQPRVTC